jgi:hypothetical protein
MLTKGDIQPPEPVLFLELAADAMTKYRASHGEYPKEWYRLDFSFANRPYREGEPGVRPKQEDGNRWRPPECEFEYEIASADAKGYRMLALNREGKAVYEIAPGWETPKKILAEPGDELCTAEQPTSKILPEPVMFLNAAAASFDRYRSIHGEYPKAWTDLNFHWALTPHRASDPATRPPATAARSWRPMGSSYSYEIERADRDFYAIRSLNDRRLPDFRITSRDRSPVPVP